LAQAPTPHWHFSRFEALSLHDLYDSLQLRCRVFVLEQGPYLDPDGCDTRSAHLLGRASASAGSALQAYLRIVDPGVRYAEPSIGRVITAPEVRGTGLGRQLMGEGIRRCHQAWPGQAVRISAQAHLAPFYASLGFVAQGAVYLEDNIPHQEMLLPGELSDGA
jgi:ElaA protein